MGKKTNGEEDPDGWRCKTMGKKGRGKKNEENADDFASLLPSITRWRSKRNADDSASLLPSITRAGTIYALFHPVKMEENTTQLDTGAIAAQAVANAAAVEAAAAATTHTLHDEDPKQTVEVIASIIAERKLEQLSTDTAALTVANAAAMKAAAGAVTFDRAAAEQTDAIDAGELAAAIIDDAEAAATINNLHEEIQRLQRLLTTEQAAREAARIAADEAAATINYLEAENKRLQHLLAAEHAAKAAKVYVPGYVIPMTKDEHLRALQRQIQYLLEQRHAPAMHAQWQPDRASLAESANGQAPTNANGPSGGDHILQHRALAKSNAATYAQAVKRDPPESLAKQSARANDLDGDQLANAASSLATVGTDPAIMMSPNVLRHNLADNAKAAAIQAAADAAAAATENPRILRAVLVAAAATANALAQAIPLDPVPPHRRGGRPPPRRANPSGRARPRRIRRPAPTPTATGPNTAEQPRQHSTIANTPPRAGQARRQHPGARPPRFDSTRSATLATRNIPPEVGPTVMRLSGRD